MVMILILMDVIMIVLCVLMVMMMNIVLRLMIVMIRPEPCTHELRKYVMNKIMIVMKKSMNECKSLIILIVMTILMAHQLLLHGHVVFLSDMSITRVIVMIIMILFIVALQRYVMD